MVFKMESYPDINFIIADDNHKYIEALSILILKNKNFKIIDTCFNSFELINNLNLSKAHVLLIDIQMPIMNGLEAARHIHNNNPNLLIIAICMETEEVYVNDIKTNGFNGYISKPEVPKNLIKIINQVLKNEFVFPENLN